MKTVYLIKKDGSDTTILGYKKDRYDYFIKNGQLKNYRVATKEEIEKYYDLSEEAETPTAQNETETVQEATKTETESKDNPVKKSTKSNSKNSSDKK